MNRVAGLDTLRALAIAWVMLFHAQIAGLGTPALAVSRMGWMGVDLFFVLSGYLIASQWFAQSGDGSPPLLDFYRRRAWRVLPAYAVVLALYFVLPGLRETPQIQPAWQFLTFTENLFIDYYDAKAFSHVWSLCVEEWFYLLFPLLALPLLRRPSMRSAVGACLAIAAAGMAWRGYVWLHDLAPLQGVGDGVGNFFQRYMERIYYPTWCRLDGLLAGVALAMLQAFRPAAWAWLMRRSGWLLLAGGAIAGSAIALFQDRFALLPTVFGYPLLALGLAAVVAAAADPASLLGRLRIPGAGLLATLAYSLYLSHKAVYHLVQQHYGDALAGHGLLAFAVYGGAALAVGGLLHFGVERPGLRMRDRRRRAAAVAAKPAAAMV
ncbi:acyltransferase family protein [Chitinimonas koreensis]|uniref:acyltransferase family protein n=1 Tax=Chitinimonas koreensis TaxID=356302 RepID=UPI0004145A0C|nr:acyltransferase [Chitinimonas koreensis]QNM95894.1 acyltransferase [Chitinimonas koreensis]